MSKTHGQQERNIALRDTLVERIKSLINQARECRWTHSRLIQELDTACKACVHIPRYHYEYCRGVRDTLIEALYHTHLVFGAMYDGAWFASDAKHPRYYEKHGINPCDYNEKSYELAWYWREPNYAKQMMPFTKLTGTRK